MLPSETEGHTPMIDAPRIDPQARSVLDQLAAGAAPMAADAGEWLAGYRAELEKVVAMQGAAPPIAGATRRVPLPDGGAIALRVYRPDDAAGRRPTALFIHGGGFVAGSLAAYDIPLRWLALRSGWQVAAIDYRLAPEHPFPAAVGDCAAALMVLLTEPDVEAGRIAVIGDSAGGCLAAVIARRARDAGLSLALQVLLYPNTDLRPSAELPEGTSYPSRADYDGAVIRMDELRRSLDLYCGTADRTLPDVSPLLAPDLAGLCPALVVTNEVDPLRDEGEAYARRLRAAGVPVEAERVEGMIHSALQRGARIARGDALITRVAERLRAAGPTAEA